MKVKTNTLYAKTKILLFLLFVVRIDGFSQDHITVALYPRTECEITISLQPSLGKGKEVNLPITLKWEKENKAVKIEFKGDRNSPERYIYAFPKLMFCKDVKKTRKEIWFDKALKQKTVERSIDNNALVNLVLEGDNDAIKTLVFRDPESRMTFYFKESSSQEGDYHIIPIKLYVASKEPIKPKSETDRKIEYLAKFTLHLALLENICESPELKKMITELDEHVKEIQNDIDQIKSETTDLARLSNDQKKDLDYRQPDGKEKKINISDKQYIVYRDCEKLKTSVTKYNAILDSYDKTVTAYNNKLGVSSSSASSSSSSSSSASCQSLKTANEKLMNLYYRIEQSKKTNLSSLQSEYNKIKQQTEINEKCKEYAAYKEWCKGIEKLLKK